MRTSDPRGAPPGERSTRRPVDGATTGGGPHTTTGGLTTTSARTTSTASRTTLAADHTVAPSTRLEVIRERAGGVLARVSAVVTAVVEVVRPLAWITIAGAVVLGILGAMLGWWELSIAAIVAAVLVVLCAAFLAGRTNYDVRLDLTRTHVVVGERAVGSLVLRNTTGRGLLPSRVVLPVGSGRGVFDVPRIAPDGEWEELFSIPTRVRGVLPVGPVSVLRGDPLGLFERVRDRQDVVDLYVHPRTTALEGLSFGRTRDLEGLPTADLSRDDVSFHALREYQPGDDLRHVHWRSSARTGQLMMRQYEETRRSHFVIGLSTHPGEYADAAEFELAISAAGSVGLRALKDSVQLDARSQHGELRARGASGFLDSLSAVTHSRPRDGSVVALAGTLAAHSTGSSIVVLATGSAVEAADLQLACSRLPADVRVLAIVADLEAEAARRQRIGSADVITIGALDHLAPALRRVLS